MTEPGVFDALREGLGQVTDAAFRR
jgi:hypothetical protein